MDLRWVSVWELKTRSDGVCDMHKAVLSVDFLRCYRRWRDEVDGVDEDVGGCVVESSSTGL